MAKFDLNDDGLVVIIGSGAGGGTLGNDCLLYTSDAADE